MATFIKAGFWEQLCKPCQGYKGWLNLDKLIADIAGPGVPGPQGPQGLQGPQGVQGLQGEPGDQGIQGVQGEQGQTGDQGPQGTAGNSVTILGSYADYAAFLAGAGSLPGANIGDAWILLSDGSLYSWNGTVWFDAGDIKGPQGDQGVQGPQGIQGEQGPQGNDGAQGIQGIQGIQGPAGTTDFHYGSFIFDSDTFLTVAIPNPTSTATIQVVSTTGFNAPGYMKIDTEIIGYTGVTPTTFTGITRGAAGSNGSNHPISSPVSQAQATVANTPTQVKLDQTDLSYGVTLSGLGDITITNAGIYNLQFSIQIQNYSNDYEDTAVWFRSNGINIPESASYVTTSLLHAGTPGASIMTVNIFYTAAINDVIALMWLSKGGSTAITSISSGAIGVPISPGVIFTVNQIA